MSQVMQPGARGICTCGAQVHTSIQWRAKPPSVASFLLKIRGWIERSREREALGHLDERLLRDIGVSRAAAAEEASKPFWM
jgi:uncharacterized protein YjiS (DUF1127 family)